MVVQLAMQEPAWHLPLQDQQQSKLGIQCNGPDSSLNSFNLNMNLSAILPNVKWSKPSLPASFMRSASASSEDSETSSRHSVSTAKKFFATQTPTVIKNSAIDDGDLGMTSVPRAVLVDMHETIENQRSEIMNFHQQLERLRAEVQRAQAIIEQTEANVRKLSLAPTAPPNYLQACKPDAQANRPKQPNALPKQPETEPEPTRQVLVERLVCGEREQHKRIFIPGRGWASKTNLREELNISVEELKAMAAQS